MQDLKEAFVDMGVIPAIADWLSLLPDKSLPHITIRSELLDILHDLPPLIPVSSMKEKKIKGDYAIVENSLKLYCSCMHRLK